MEKEFEFKGFFLFFDFVEVFDGFTGGAELDEDGGGFFYGDVPVFLEVEDKLPYCERYVF